MAFALSKSFLSSFLSIKPNFFSLPRNNPDPRLLVIIMTQFVKSTVRPCPSVKRPSSSTCSKILKKSACAFSTSSKRMTLYGFLRTASVNCPPSSYPTYPGGAPTRRDTSCFSIYSDISKRSIFFSLPNIVSANALANSVLPTPVEPRNRNEPIGLFGSFIPALARRIALATAVTASSCPITRLWSSSSKWSRRSESFCFRFWRGTPVHLATTSATSSSVTTKCSWSPPFHSPFIFSICPDSSFAWSLNMAARSKFWADMAASFSFWTEARSSSFFFKSSGVEEASIRTLAAASSITSIALSGWKRSVI